MANKASTKLFISYSWKVRADAVRKIASRLKQDGLDVWIDIDNMADKVSMIDAMAQGIQNAHIVVCFFSEYYAKSPYCLREIMYACKKDKDIVTVRVQRDYEPEGKLEFLLADKFWIEYSDDGMFTSAIDKILAQIEASNGANETTLQDDDDLKLSDKRIERHSSLGNRDSNDTKLNEDNNGKSHGMSIEEITSKFITADFKNMKLFISYSRSFRKKAVEKIADFLQDSAGYKVWIDRNDITNYRNANRAMAEGISDAQVVLCFYSDAYERSDKCIEEIQFTLHKKKPIVPIRLQQDCIPGPVLATAIVDKFTINYSRDDQFEIAAIDICNILHRYENQ